MKDASNVAPENVFRGSRHIKRLLKMRGDVANVLRFFDLTDGGNEARRRSTTCVPSTRLSSDVTTPVWWTTPPSSILACLLSSSLSSRSSCFTSSLMLMYIIQRTIHRVFSSRSPLLRQSPAVLSLSMNQRAIKRPTSFLLYSAPLD